MTLDPGFRRDDGLIRGSLVLKSTRACVRMVKPLQESTLTHNLLGQAGEWDFFGETGCFFCRNPVALRTGIKNNETEWFAA